MCCFVKDSLCKYIVLSAFFLNWFFHFVRLFAEPDSTLWQSLIIFHNKPHIKLIKGGPIYGSSINKIISNIFSTICMVYKNEYQRTRCCSWWWLFHVECASKYPMPYIQVRQHARQPLLPYLTKAYALFKADRPSKPDLWSISSDKYSNCTLLQLHKGRISLMVINGLVFEMSTGSLFVKIEK